MNKSVFTTDSDRLEAFSDGVLAVIITIMVLDLKQPHGTDLGALRSVLPTFEAYVLSFMYIGIYWNNHHHMLRAVKRIDGRAMWMNLHLLFWLSLIPFTTGWLGENPFAVVPTVVYGLVLFCSAVAYFILQASLIAANGRDTPFARAVNSDLKGKVTTVLYVVAIATAFVWPPLSQLIFLLVTLMWFVPDRRLEHAITSREEH